MNGLLQQATKFASVGVAATLIHVATALLLHNGFGVSALQSNFFAFLVASLFSYFGNWIWTFDKSGTLRKSLPRFIVLSMGCFVINQSIVYGMVETLQLPLWLAMVPVVAVIPIASFWFSKSRVFVNAELQQQISK
jgi:putative flippase GtrA